MALNAREVSGIPLLAGGPSNLAERAGLPFTGKRGEP